MSFFKKRRIWLAVWDLRSSLVDIGTCRKESCLHMGVWFHLFEPTAGLFGSSFSGGALVC